MGSSWAVLGLALTLSRELFAMAGAKGAYTQSSEDNRLVLVLGLHHRFPLSPFTLKHESGSFWHLSQARVSDE